MANTLLLPRAMLVAQSPATLSGKSQAPSGLRRVLGRSRGPSRAKFIVRAADGDQESSEDVAARLAKAEAEAAELRKMLAEVQAPSDEELAKAKPVTANKRVDGTGFRETIWSVQKGRGDDATTVETGEQWLQEGDVTFFTGDGPSELGESAGMSEEDKSTVTRRLLIGLGGVAAFIAIANIPDKEVRPKPSKPLFFYLVPLVRVQNLLPDLEATVKSGNATAVKAAVQSVLGSPNNAKDNLSNAALCLDDDKDYERAKGIAVEFAEYMSTVDFSEYFDSRAAISEKQVTFSVQAVKAAEAKLAQFLAFMPAEQLEAARSQVAY
uniref:Uncharacterized protein n=1 Tax=Pyramimonas obovata TaxID=1411642 RepID=A0A7S0WMP1_9CHLO|mmetsp:Transcript_30977/g.67677  ORF Transcript_30977/g.67677 Transcript_30977/m.67677 type:complete len:324 (+) Transcript_30977:79-1050(+)|eukprot:CAMPEP_0118923582 /NCGR_PEP_ID=MMETSP1169-20130426/2053_1 /TAXON_ID=36882 /ORGANISM="Pyramimonas obovata, Strain CCMP722" /LENGTH=323 /DNA_ID=CAMNT_0006864595 /DNA_START=79 /DNA_END=1050 /DNA_ORIENTATION=+